LDEFASLQFFTALPGDTLMAISRRCRVRRFSAGQHVLNHQEASTDVFFVLEGRVRVLLYSPSGRDVSFRDLLPGEVFGELAAIDAGPRSATVVAREPTRLAVVSQADFLELIRTYPDVAHALLRHLVGLIRRYSQRVYELSTLGVEQRVRLEILRTACDLMDDGGKAILRPAPTLAEIASRVSTTSEAVSREIARLAREGFIAREGKDLVVYDVGRLSMTVENLLD